MKEKLLISFSGGETSGYMTQYLWSKYKDEMDIRIVFANTGEENEETLEFVHKCSEYFNLPIIWVEASVHHGIRKGTGFKIVDFASASRNGEPFEEVIKKYGIPNQMYPHCTRELKLAPIHAYMKSIGWSGYKTAIGIRLDEIDRMSEKKSKWNLYYPLISEMPMTKPKINFWWSQQPFRLKLKGYEGNCKACWKKSKNKLYRIAKDTPEKFGNMLRWEELYGNYIPAGRLKDTEEENLAMLPFTFFRGNVSSRDILEKSKDWDGEVFDDHLRLDEGNESCEVFTECGMS